VKVFRGNLGIAFNSWCLLTQTICYGRFHKKKFEINYVWQNYIFFLLVVVFVGDILSIRFLGKNAEKNLP
jgi:hypothetical protein